MISAKDVYQAQGNLRHLEFDRWNRYEDIQIQRSKGATLLGAEDKLAEMDREIEQAKAEIKVKQEELGGKIYRVPVENLSTFESKVAKLNKRAAKLDCEPTTYKVIESEEEERKIAGPGGVPEKRLYVWNYVALNAVKPMVPGYRFIAALDHTVQQKDGDPVIVKQVPSVEEELDLSAWRYADPRCDHCKKIRTRNTTYLVEETETGKISKVGSSCLRDFTGANDPERVAALLEYIADFEESVNEDSEDYGSYGRRSYRTIEYLTHVAACIRRDGWTPRSMEGWDSYPTADAAWSNLHNYGEKDKKGRCKYIPLEEDDRETAEKSVEWAKGLEGATDFEHNLKTMAGLEFMPEKGDGIVAYIVQGFVKDETKRREREAEQKRREEALANAEEISEGRQVITGQIVKRYEKEDGFGVHQKMTILDDRGFTVNGTVPREILRARAGDRVTFTGTVKPKDGDPLYGWYKRPSKAQIIEKEVA